MGIRRAKLVALLTFWQFVSGNQRQLITQDQRIHHHDVVHLIYADRAPVVTASIARELKDRIGTGYRKVSLVTHLLKLDTAPELIQWGYAPHLCLGKVWAKVRKIYSKRLGCRNIVFRHSPFLRHGQLLNIENRFACYPIQHEDFGTLGWHQNRWNFLTIRTGQIYQDRLRRHIVVP